ncbi:hypothetical protein CsSME_00048373 [Camellia sinensis var. sinensis]
MASFLGVLGPRLKQASLLWLHACDTNWAVFSLKRLDFLRKLQQLSRLRESSHQQVQMLTNSLLLKEANGRVQSERKRLPSKQSVMERSIREEYNSRNGFNEILWTSVVKEAKSYRLIFWSTYPSRKHFVIRGMRRGIRVLPFFPLKPREQIHDNKAF